jgi:hypothetical protein
MDEIKTYARIKLAHDALVALKVHVVAKELRKVMDDMDESLLARTGEDLAELAKDVVL